MKRCPQCNRVETDEALKFCRVDGATLVNDSSSIGTEVGTADLSSAPNASEVHTSILPQNTDANINRGTTPTTVLPGQSAGTTTGALAKPRKRKTAIIVGIIAVVVFAVVAVFVINTYLSQKRTTPIESIAVLPFENRSGNSDTDYLSDGLPDSLIYRLSQLPNLKVIPTTSVMRYKGKGGDAAQIAKELNVDAVVSGRLIQLGDSLNISVQFIDARNDKLLWADQYDRKMSDLLATQREIAATIAEKLQLKLSGADATGITKKYTNDNDAYQLYLKGRFNWNKRTDTGLKAAIECYEKAIERDPGFALAYEGLAETYVIMGAYGSIAPTEAMPKAKAGALRALELDPMLAEPHATLAAYNGGYAWNFEAAERELRKAIELDPKYATAWHWLGNFLPIVGKNDEAIAAGRRAEELDPLSAIIAADTGFDLIIVRRYDEALEQAKHTLTIDQNFWYAYYIEAMARELKGKPDEAIAPAQKAVELFPSPITKGRLATILAKAGQRPAAKKLLDELIAESAKTYVQGYYVATAQLALGDKDAALASLERDLHERGIYMQWIPINPEFDSLKDDPRFKNLVNRMASLRLDS